VRLLEPGGRSRFLIPPPTLEQTPLTSLRVTAFRDYLACPYRFYLRHVLRLGEIDDRAPEMDALAYGSLAHTVLEQFGQSDVADATEAEAINTFINDTLSALASSRFGRDARPAVRVQIEQLRERLRRFADHQAAMARDGWRIRPDLLEKQLDAEIDIDGEPFTVTGTIDRIDEHPQLGFRLLDYKTSDAGDAPERTHFQRQRWVDLQLPLYRALVAPRGIDRVALGYVNLPKDADRAGLKLAGWTVDDLADADGVRDWVIGQVRGQRFWPPNEDPPVYADDYRRIAADAAMGRKELIARSTGGGDD
jgi:RecB family exonuclease